MTTHDDDIEERQAFTEQDNARWQRAITELDEIAERNPHLTDAATTKRRTAAEHCAEFGHDPHVAGRPGWARVYCAHCYTLPSWETTTSAPRSDGERVAAIRAQLELQLDRAIAARSAIEIEHRRSRDWDERLARANQTVLVLRDVLAQIGETE